MQSVLSNYQEVQDKITKDLELLKLSSDFTLIAEKSLKSTVSINVYNQDYTSGFLGAGFFVSPGGYAITNYHVIKYMSYVDIITNSEETYRAKVIGYDEFKDVALLKVELNTTYLELENSDNVQVGEKVIAIGNPLGLESSITQGVVSGLKRQGDNNLQAYIQTDVSINPGNSGGPLINSKGKVIGINTFKYVDASVEGMGFALESNEIKATVNKIAGFTLIE
jgi:serine protease Do